MDVVASFPADARAAEAMQPRGRALYDVAEDARTSAVRFALLRARGADPMLPEQATVVVVVVTERDALAVGGEAVLASRTCSVDRAGSAFGAARTCEESITAREETGSKPARAEVSWVTGDVDGRQTSDLVSAWYQAETACRHRQITGRKRELAEEKAHNTKAHNTNSVERAQTVLAARKQAVLLSVGSSLSLLPSRLPCPGVRLFPGRSSGGPLSGTARDNPFAARQALL